MLGIKEIKEIIPTAIHFFWWTALRSWSRACGLLDIKQSHITSRIFPVTSRRSR